MTTLVIEVRSPDGSRTFELLVSYGETVTVAETCIEVFDGRREWRDTRDVLLLVGRQSGGAR